MIETGTLLGIMLFGGIEDIRKKRVSLTVLSAGAVTALLYHIFWRSHTIVDMLLGSIIGALLLLCARLTGGKVGMGDGLFLMMTGLFLGWQDNLAVFFLGTLLAGMYGLAMFALKMKRPQDEIAFIPFLGAAYLILSIGRLVTNQ